MKKSLCLFILLGALAYAQAPDLTTIRPLPFTPDVRHSAIPGRISNVLVTGATVRPKLIPKDWKVSINQDRDTDLTIINVSVPFLAPYEQAACFTLLPKSGSAQVHCLFPAAGPAGSITHLNF